MMKLLLPLTYVEAPLGPEWSRPLGLMPAGNGRVIDQMLFSARKYLEGAAVFLGGPGAAVIARAVEPAHEFIPLRSNLPAALLACRDQWVGGPVVLALGDAVIDADLGGLAAEVADGVAFIHHAEPGETGPGLAVSSGRIRESDGLWRASGLWWFRNGALLAAALADWAEEGGADGLTRVLLQQGATVAARVSDLRVPLAGSGPEAERLLTLNHRLLGFGRSSEDAIERSYGEDFTVLTPVSLAETATIDRAVIGPYATIGAGAVVRGSVVSNTIIGPGATVEDAILEGAIIGDGAVVRGRRWASRAADTAVLSLEA